MNNSSYLHSHDNSDSDNEDKTLNLIIQIVGLVILLLIALIFGLIPFYIKTFRNNIKITGIANAFSAGIFIGVAYIHILPETINDMNDYLVDNDYIKLSKLPICYFIVFIAYSLILFIEKILFDSHSLIHHEHEDGHNHNHNQNPQIEDGKENNKNSISDENDNDEDENEEIKNLLSTKEKIGSYYKNNDFSKSFHNLYKEKEIDVFNKNNEDLLSKSISSQNNQNPIRSMINNNLNKHFNDVFIKKKREKKEEQIIIKDENHNHNHDHHQNSSNALLPYLLLAALSFHGIFEGIAVGLQKSTKSIIFLLIAVIGHKWAEGLTLGISFAKTQTEKGMFIKMILLFSLFTPIGIGVGLLLENSSLPKYIECIFMSLTVGTFTYIACSEIVVEEFTVSRYKIRKILFFIIGILLILGMTIWEISGEEE